MRFGPLQNGIIVPCEPPAVALREGAGAASKVLNPRFEMTLSTIDTINVEVGPTQRKLPFAATLSTQN